MNHPALPFEVQEIGQCEDRLAALVLYGADEKHWEQCKKDVKAFYQWIEDCSTFMELHRRSPSDS